jgi:polyhydroxybutyrate depolymerase
MVPYGGGRVDFWRHGRVISAAETARLWVKADGCRATPATGNLPDAAPGDGCQVHWSRWSGGQGGSAVWLYTIAGGGHTWPRGPQYLPRWLIGPVCEDFDPGAAIWEFFKNHPKRH